jgi:YVTN family beta-propeller protein
VIDPHANRVVADTPVGIAPENITAGVGGVWVANTEDDTISNIDPRSRRVIRTLPVGGNVDAVAADSSALWAVDSTCGIAARIDPTVDSVVKHVRVGDRPGVGNVPNPVAVGGGAVWVANTLADTLQRIDPSTDSVTTTIAVGSRPRGVAFGDGSVWVANSGDGTVSRVAAKTSRVVATIPVGQSPQALVVTPGAVWVSVDTSPAAPASAPGSPPRVLRIAREGPFSSTDSALAIFDPQATQMFYAKCAGLLTYPDRPAPDGTRLTPDVAKALPTVSADGRTYTFTLRSGFHFSQSDAPVTAATFKHTIERALDPELHCYATDIMGDIVGMPAFEAGRTAHLAGVTASGDRLQIRLTAPSPDLPARTATLAFCAVPDDTPMTAQRQPIPSAGPYYVVSSSRDELVLARNPNYGGDRPRIPTRIVYSFGVGLRRAVMQVATERSDYLDASSFSSGGNSANELALLQMLERRYGAGSPAARAGHQQYFVNPWLSLDYFAFNTARPLFASARVRRAVNYAIDRRALVQHHALLDVARATDHYLVPGIPAARPVRIYPLGAPNLGRRLRRPVHDDQRAIRPSKRHRELRPLQQPRLYQAHAPGSHAQRRPATTSLRPTRRGPHPRRPAQRPMGHRHAQRFLLPACGMSDLPADLRDRPRKPLPSTLKHAMRVARGCRDRTRSGSHLSPSSFRLYDGLPGAGHRDRLGDGAALVADVVNVAAAGIDECVVGGGHASCCLDGRGAQAWIDGSLATARRNGVQFSPG